MLGPLLLLIASPSYVEIRGNVALPEDVYLTVLSLTSSTASVTPARVENVLTHFLHDSGYEIAVVTARLSDHHIAVDVDEGRLDKVIFVGESSASALRLQLAVDLPGHIYNRPLLEKKLAAVIEATDVISARYDIVPVEEVEHPGIQLPDPGLIPGVKIFRPGEPHELRIHLLHEGWVRGIDATFGLRAPDGLFLRAGYKHGGLFADRDEAEVGGRIAVRIVDALAAANARLGLSEASVRLAWFTPPFAADTLRALFTLEALTLGARRRDLGIRSYLQSPLRASLDFQLSLLRSFALGLGFGFEQRFLYALHDEKDVPRDPLVDATPRHEARLFGLFEADAVFNPEELRRDRKHELSLRVRALSASTQEAPPIVELSLDWQKMLALGWDELWFGVDGVALFGDVPFYDERSLGDPFLRTTFSRLYVKKAGAVHLEYRLSLSRDIFKISLYDDFAVYHDEKVRVVDELGLGLHLLVIDTFQLSAFLGGGLNSMKELDVGVGLEAKQAF